MKWQASASLSVIRQRAQIYRQIRAFFDARDCLEVDTPLMQASTNTDVNIESITAFSQGQKHYLQTSPEFAMKRLIASGIGSIYQICHAFRDGEKGRRHHPEFTLLEWYRIGYDYQQLMDEVELLINQLSQKQHAFQRISYHQLIFDHLGIAIDKVTLSSIRKTVVQLISGTYSADLSFDACLDLLISLVIAPKMQGYIFVYDYPVSQASLARVKPDNPAVAERFELFYNGLELANGFSELCDEAQQRERFQQDNLRRQANNQAVYPMDELLLSALASGLEECAGVAIGLDRLLMVLLDKNSIDQVLVFVD